MIQVIMNDRLKGKLTYGVTNTPTVMWTEGEYRGELNKQGEAHGRGVFTTVFNVVYTGTFFENSMDGVCVRTCEKDKIFQIGEMKDSLWNGR